MINVWGKEHQVFSLINDVAKGATAVIFQIFVSTPKALLFVVTALCFFITPPEHIQAQPVDNTGLVEEKVEKLLKRMELLEERLRESEAKREELTEEVKHLRSDLQAAAAPKPPAPPETPSDVAAADETLLEELTAGWDKGFYVRSTDGSFEFRPVGILHVDFRGHEDERQINTNDTLANTFDVRRLRLGFEGFLFSDIGYNFEVNIDEGEAELIYAYANFGYVPWGNIRLGQFKEPFSYEVLYPEKYLDFVERSNIATAIGPAEDIGIMAHNFGHPYAGIVEYGIGVFNGEGIHLNDKANSDMEVAGRLALLPFSKGPDWLKKSKIAANATYSGNQRRDFGFRPRTSEGFEFFPRIPVDGERIRLGGDMQWYYGPFSVKAEYLRAEEERDNGMPELIIDGWHVDATWLKTGEEKKLALESGWELAVRYEEARANAQESFPVPGYTDTAGDSVLVRDNKVRSLTVGFNKYLCYNVKFQINYQHSWFDDSFLTPDSRTGESVLSRGDDSLDKILARMQLFF